MKFLGRIFKLTPRSYLDPPDPKAIVEATLASIPENPLPAVAIPMAARDLTEHLEPYWHFIADSRLRKVLEIAAEYDWHVYALYFTTYSVVFTKNGTRLEVRYERIPYHVLTTLDHPKYGKNAKWRWDIDIPLLRKIFEYPRVHIKEYI